MIKQRLQMLAEAEPLADGMNPFTDFDEKMLVGLALDLPEYFQSVADLLDFRLFSLDEVKYIMSYLLDHHAKHNIIPTRAMTASQIKKELTVDSEIDSRSIISIIDTPLNPRNIPTIKETLHSWARKKSFGLLFQEDAVSAYHQGNYDKLEEIVNKANRMVETSARGFWLYEQAEELYIPDRSPHLTTGYPQLDRVLNNGGPSPGEVVCWLAATGVGKCHTLQTRIYEESLSRIYELEAEDGEVYHFAGYRWAETNRGTVRVCDLVETDHIISLPVEKDYPDIIMPVL